MAIRDVVVVGAGPAGSSVSTVLADLGWDVLLLERDRFPRHKVCGEFLSPESQTSLRAMGLYAPIAARGPSNIERALLVSRLGVSLHAPLPGEAWGISRFAMDAALVDAAMQRGVEVWTGATVTAVRTGTPCEVDVRASDGLQRVQARTVIAACGRHTPNGLPPSTSRSNGDLYVGVKCHYEGISMPDQVELFLFPGGYAGVAPVEEKRVNVCLMSSYEAFAEAGKSVRAMIEAAATWNEACGRRLNGGRPLPDTEVSTAPVDTDRPAAPWDAVACLGDTALMVPPLYGDGIAMALRSAELCAPLAHEFLVGRLSLSEWEQRYREAWQQEFAPRVRIGRRLDRLLKVPVLSDVCVGVVGTVPPVARYLTQATRGRA